LKLGGIGVTAKEYLNQARVLDMLINAKQSELYSLKLMATSISSPVISEKVQSGGENNTMRIIDKIVDLQNEINLEIDKLVTLKSEIREKIGNVYNQKFITLLTDKYINGFTLEQIAERMDISYTTICKLHEEALEIFRYENNIR
jgi:DNA-directed RNA polymerase specialized sigma subunit